MSTEPLSTEQCLDGTLCGAHVWVETYYGTKCERCETFYPHGCAPWDDDVRVGFDFDDGDEDECPHGLLECEYCIDCDLESYEEFDE